MSEVMNYKVSSSPEKPDLDLIHDYLQVLRTEDVNQYNDARGRLDDVMYDNTPDYHSGEIYTCYTPNALSVYLQVPSPDTRRALQQWQTASAIHVVRGMIQGKKFPINQFGEVISDVHHAMVAIDGGQKSNSQHDKRIRGEIVDVWSDASWRISGYVDPIVMRRAAEAYKFVGRSRNYGRMMARVALAEKKRGMY